MKTCAKLLRLPLPQLEVMLNQPKQLIVSTAPEIETPQPPIPFEIEVRTSSNPTPEPFLTAEQPEQASVQDTPILVDTDTHDELPASLSRAEFNALFAPYELKMRAILEDTTFCQ